MDEEFYVTQEHIDVLPYLCWTDSGTVFGGPSVDPEKPFGTRDFTKDLCTILDTDNTARAIEIYMDLVVILEIMCKNNSVYPGQYFKVDAYWVHENDLNEQD